MKKKSLLAAVCCLPLFIFISCESTKISLQEHSPMAIISIVGNTQIPWVDHEEEATTPTGEPEAETMLTSMVTKFIDSKNPELLTAVDRLDYVYESLAQNLPDLTGIQVLPKDEVISDEYYKNLRASYFNMLSATKNATDYKDLSTIGAKPARILLKNLGAKSALIVSCTFQKDIAKGNRSSGLVKGISTIKIKLINEKGKEVLNKIYTSDTELIKISGSKYNKDELVSAFNEATDNTIRQFCMDLSNNSTDSVISDNSETSEGKNEEIKSTPIMIKKALKPASETADEAEKTNESEETGTNEPAATNSEHE